MKQSVSPHCDNLVLHAPGACEYCDMYPDAQQRRVLSKVNFTGQQKEDFATCPSELRRPLSVIQKWPGNRPNPEIP